MLVAAGQFAVTSVWEKNAEICASLMAQAAENDVSLFVLPEALLARDDHDADLSVKSAQLLEGEFLGRLRRESKRNMMTTILTIHVPSTPGRAWNMLVALQAGNIVFQSWRWHRHYRELKSWYFLPPGFAGRSKSIIGQRCLPLVRWIPPVIWWRRGSAGTKISVKAGL